jgi:hypothetical protein
MLAAAIALALAVQDPAAAAGPAAAWRRFDGAGASLEVPPGVAAEENASEQAYFLDLRRLGALADRSVAFVRVVIVPDASRAPEQVAAGVRAGAVAALREEGWELQGAAATRAELAGDERDGERLRFAGAEERAAELDLFAFREGAQIVCVLTKSDALAPAADRAAHARILRGLALRPVAGNEPILVRLGPVGVRLPAMTIVAKRWGGVPETGSAQLRRAEGNLTLFAQDCGSASAARAAEQFTFQEFVLTARRDAEASGGALAVDGHAAGLMVAGARVVPFQRVALSAGAARHEVLAAVVRDGDWIFALQLAAPAAAIPAADRRFQQLLASLDFCHDAPPPLRPLAGRGLRLQLPAIFRVGAHAGQPFVLEAVADHESASDLPALFFAWRSDAPSDLHERLRAEMFPDVAPTGAGSWTTPGPLGEAVFRVSLLGPQGEYGLLATAARGWRDGALSVALRLPHARNALQAQELLGAVLADAHELAPDERVRLRADPVFLDLPDGDWLGWETRGATRHEVAVAAPWGEFRLGATARASAAPADDEALVRLARATLDEALAPRAESWRADAARVEDWVELPGTGRTARVRQDLRADGRSAFLEAYAASAPSADLRAWAFAAGAADGAARAELARLLAAIGCE